MYNYLYIIMYKNVIKLVLIIQNVKLLNKHSEIVKLLLNESW